MIRRLVDLGLRAEPTLRDLLTLMRDLKAGLDYDGSLDKHISDLQTTLGEIDPLLGSSQ